MSDSRKEQAAVNKSDDTQGEPARAIKKAMALTARERQLLIRELAEIQVELKELSERAEEIAARSGPPTPLI